MRTPNHLEVKATCLAAIPEILSAVGQEPALKIVTDMRGWVNPCFFAGEDLVVRFNARDPQLSKFQREKMVFEKLRDLQFPVPQWVYLNDTRIHAPYDYLVASRLPGQNIEECWKLISLETRSSLAFQAGQWLRKLHEVSFEKFGEISEDGPFPKSDSWTEFLEFRLNYHLKESAELGLFTKAQEKAIREAFNSSRNLLDEVTQKTLIHGDFHLGNLLFDGEVITGVPDFEWACVGDPLFDLSSLRDMDSTWPDSQHSFDKGYGDIPVTPEIQQKMKLYRAIQNIELCVVAKKYFPEEELASYLSITTAGF